MSNNEIIRETIILNDNSLETQKIVQLGPVYPLSEVNFYKIKSGPSGFKDWSKRIFFMSLGWIFKIISVVIVFLIAVINNGNDKHTIQLDLSKWEIVMVGLALLVCLILYFFGRKYKNDKDKLISEIDKFFKKNSNNEK